MNTSFINNNRNSFRRTRQARGFTLTEILIAIALIVTIVAVAVANLGNIYLKNQINAAHLFVSESVKTPLMSYRLDNGSLPNSEQGLAALIAPPDNTPNWKGPYLEDNIKQAPLDPWQHAYRYASPGTHNPASYDCWSDGPDGVGGTADDVGNW